ncbi:sulfatase [Pediococcus siamensis]|uniref:sulfatase n=1 Tax=Pediococcus siamensis TaxID=381829 RepID=UPI0039A3E879
MFDTLSKRFLSNYGNSWIKTPNFQRLQKKMVTFDNFYGGSLPCIPARRELHTGMYNFPFRSWGPLEVFDQSAIEKLKNKGVYSHIVTDHSHYWEDGGATYLPRYSSWEGFRGQEGDRWVSRLEREKNENKNELNKKGISVDQHMANITRIHKEANISSVRTINAGIDFLQKNADKKNWFLQIESFDPHEPFYVPEKYRQMYNCIDSRDIPYWPTYQKLVDDRFKDDLEDLKKEYAALITMCDHYLGKILDVLDQNDMWKDTLVIVNTDHGFLLGEHNWIGKNISPVYDELVHLPFFIHDPSHQNLDGKVCGQIAQTIDLPETLLDYFSIQDDTVRDGKSILKILAAAAQNQVKERDILFGVNGSFACVYDGHYVYMRASQNPDNEPLVNYTLAYTQMRGFYSSEEMKSLELVKGNRFTHGIQVGKIALRNQMDSYALGNYLFDIKHDPDQNYPLHDKRLESKMIEKLTVLLKKIEAPKEEFVRLGLSQN